jgi:M6 family metalloprotease-like protein
MTPRKLAASLIALAIAFSALQGGAGLAASVAGTKCTAIGKTLVSGGKTYVCKAVGRNKSWALKSVTAAPTPSPSVVTGSFAACRLPVADNRGDVALGIPRIAARGKDTGDVHSTVIFVDFPDAKATMTPDAAFAKINPRATQIFSEVSYGKLNYILEPNLHWFTMSKPSTAYSYASFDGQHSFAAEALALADPTTDFSKSDSFVIITNPDQRALPNGPAVSYSADFGFHLDGNNLHNGATSGADINYWGAIWLNHEISHSFGAVDLYSATGNTYETQFQYTGEFSYMGLSDERSQAPGLLAWERYVLGWLDESQLVCSPNGVGNYSLTPIETAGGIKAVVIPTGRTTALVVEDRRALGLDSKLAKPGLLVYRVDTSKTSGYGPVQVISNATLAADPRYLKAPLAVGESVTVDGFTFKHTATASGSDALAVTR